MQYIDCGAAAESIKKRCRAGAEEFRARGIVPTLGMVRVGEKGPDISYEKGASKTMSDAGIETRIFVYDADISQEDYIAEIEKINADPSIHGILAFRPLDNIDENEAIGRHLAPEKDVDACTAVNMGRLVLGDPDGLFPCTAAGIMDIIDQNAGALRDIRLANDTAFSGREGADICSGLKVCIYNSTNVIGKPLAMMLTNRSAAVSFIRSMMSQEDRARIASEADLLIAATPVRNSVTADMVKPGAMVIDASVIREKLFSANGGPVIDEKTGRQKTGVFGCCADDAAAKAAYITPVPGMGRVTSAMLAANLIKACGLQCG